MRRALVLALCCPLLGCASDKRETAPAPARAPSSETHWVPAREASSLAWLEGPARVIAAPNAAALISAPLTARVLRVRVRPGQLVEQGEALVDVVMPELMRAAGVLRAADIRLAALLPRRERLAPLLAEGLARTQEVAELDAAIALARADRESARATLRSAGESDAHVAALVEGTGTSALRAPLPGMVVAVTAQLGQVREPASGPLVELVGDAATQIEARFTSQPPAQVRFEWLGLGVRVPLVLEAVSPRAGPDGTRLAWLHAADAAVAPIAGSLGRVRMLAPKDWVVVPVRALFARDGAPSVRVQQVDGSSVSPVTLVRQNESEAVIEGLAVGTLVAADGELAATTQRARETAP